MKHKIVEPKDEWADNIKEYVKYFRERNPFYPIDPFARVSEQRMEFIMDDNFKYQMMLDGIRREQILEEAEEAPY